MLWESELDKLIGSRITDVYVMSDRVLCFVFDKGNEINKNLFVICCADCCSETWFSDLRNVGHILNKEITSVEIDDEHPFIKGYNIEDGRGRQEYDQLYHFILKTKCGKEAIFCYRNSSNGYYGGWIATKDEIDYNWFPNLKYSYSWAAK